jgi:Domain of unknown function (DUF4907)
MIKWGNKSGEVLLSVSFLLFSAVLMFSAGCRDSKAKMEKYLPDSNTPQVAEPEVDPAYIKFRTFQNTDSSWGYTVFLNSRPYLHYTRIGLNKEGSGFASEKDAVMVAEFVVKMIKSGDMSPNLSKKTIDSLEQQISIMDQSGK